MVIEPEVSRRKVQAGDGVHNNMPLLPAFSRSRSERVQRGPRLPATKQFCRHAERGMDESTELGGAPLIDA